MIYIVYSEQGEYSDHSVENLFACKSEANAIECCRLLNAGAFGSIYGEDWQKLNAEKLQKVFEENPGLEKLVNQFSINLQGDDIEFKYQKLDIFEMTNFK